MKLVLLLSLGNSIGITYVIAVLFIVANRKYQRASEVVVLFCNQSWVNSLELVCQIPVHWKSNKTEGAASFSRSAKRAMKTPNEHRVI